MMKPNWRRTIFGAHFYGLYVSDVISYNADGEQADVEEFILQQMQNKCISIQLMEVHTVRGDFQVAMNGIINSRFHLHYTLKDGKFYYHQIKHMDEQARVSFGNWEYPYHEFLGEINKYK